MSSWWKFCAGDSLQEFSRFRFYCWFHCCFPCRRKKLAHFVQRMNSASLTTCITHDMPVDMWRLSVVIPISWIQEAISSPWMGKHCTWTAPTSTGWCPWARKSPPGLLSPMCSLKQQRWAWRLCEPGPLPMGPTIIPSKKHRECSTSLLSRYTTQLENCGFWLHCKVEEDENNEFLAQGLDFAISEAKKHGIWLILSLVNNYADYGGKPQYVEWANTYAGTNLTSEDDFFSDATIRAWFKDYIRVTQHLDVIIRVSFGQLENYSYLFRLLLLLFLFICFVLFFSSWTLFGFWWYLCEQTIVTRVNTIGGVAYRDEPAIFAWELMNEPRCGSDPTGNVFQAWYT